MLISWARLPALGFFAGFAWTLSVYPLAGTWLPLIFAVYAGLLLWRPQLWLLALPAMLPVLDLAPRTGWFFLEEIDLLLLLTAGLVYWRLPQTAGSAPAWPSLFPLFRLGLLLLSMAVAIGLWRGLHPWSPVDANTFNNYLSPANALRIAKAWCWTLVLLPPLRQAAGTQLLGLRLYLVPGMLLGLLTVSLAALRERMQFTGLFNFSTDYRISAPFSAMHTGGAALDGYLALGIPLLAAWLMPATTPARKLAALALLPLAWYVALATFSRGLYLGLGAAILIVALPTLVRRPVPALAAAALSLLTLDAAFRLGGYRALGPALLALMLLALARYRRAAAPLLAAVLLCGAAVPIYHGDFVNLRFAQVGGDWHTRLQHWQHTLAMMDNDLATRWFGVGLGKFPVSYYWRNLQREQPPSFQFIDQGSNRNLRLAAGEYAAGYGELLRFWQGVPIRPGHDYQLGIDVLNNGAPAVLQLNLCQRHLLYPQNCVVVPLRQIQYSPSWQRYLYTIHSGKLGGDGVPVKLEIAVEGQRAVLDIDNVSLRDTPGFHELLRNGSFSDANSYWFFSSDRSHLPWHVKNLALNLYFEMGWLGLSGYALMLVGAVAVLLRRRDSAMLGALLAFQVVGLFDSLLDVPRIALLSTLLLCAAALQAKESRS